MGYNREWGKEALPQVSSTSFKQKWKYEPKKVSIALKNLQRIAVVVRVNSATAIFCNGVLPQMLAVIGGDSTLTVLSLQATFCSVSHPVSQQSILFSFSNKCNPFSYEKYKKFDNKGNECIIDTL